MMKTTYLEFDTLPSTGLMMLRGALRRKRGLSNGVTVPRFEARMNGLQISQLAAYQSICGFKASEVVPVTMPQVLAAPLHIAVLTHPEFPIPAMGIVHVSNQITQERPILSHEMLDVLVWVEGHRQARKGYEIDVVTEIHIDGHAVWTGITTVLSMAVPGHGRKSESVQVPSPTVTHAALFSMKANLGRRYGTIAGDRNPIHLWPITAKLFGFKRHIIHGMWLLARAIAEFDAELGEGRIQVDVAFRRPVFLPGAVRFSAGPTDSGLAFRLDNPLTDKNHLFGAVRLVDV
ncbi:MAG: MaoC/PaaZ C-terminal domain-containing protein [Myxococcota bacterium]|nr:MaoC/PaaZ C-terminal domain-containing protein [Myxococcota bacterium]